MQNKNFFVDIAIPIIRIKRSWYRLIFIMGIPRNIFGVTAALY